MKVLLRTVDDTILVLVTEEVFMNVILSALDISIYL